MLVPVFVALFVVISADCFEDGEVGEKGLRDVPLTALWWQWEALLEKFEDSVDVVEAAAVPLVVKSILQLIDAAPNTHAWTMLLRRLWCNAVSER